MGASLQKVVKAGKVAGVRKLLEHQCAESGRSASEVVNERDVEGHAALHYAAQYGSLEIVELLLAIGADPDVRDVAVRATPLMKACTRGQAQVVVRLLEAGASVAAVDKFAQSPLHFACWVGSADLVTVLVDAGATVDASTVVGQTPLFWASGRGFADAARRLLNAGANPNWRDANGDTPLHRACHNGFLPCVEVLAEFRADFSLQNKYGQTPHAMALAKRHTALLQYCWQRELECSEENGGDSRPAAEAAARSVAATADAYAAAKRGSLAITGAMLQRHLERRPERSELERRNILRGSVAVAPQLAMAAEQLTRQRTRDHLERQLQERPSAEELERRQVLIQVANPLFRGRQHAGSVSSASRESAAAATDFRARLAGAPLPVPPKAPTAAPVRTANEHTDSGAVVDPDAQPTRRRTGSVTERFSETDLNVLADAVAAIENAERLLEARSASDSARGQLEATRARLSARLSSRLNDGELAELRTLAGQRKRPAPPPPRPAPAPPVASSGAAGQPGSTSSPVPALPRAPPPPPPSLGAVAAAATGATAATATAAAAAVAGSAGSPSSGAPRPAPPTAPPRAPPAKPAVLAASTATPPSSVPAPATPPSPSPSASPAASSDVDAQVLARLQLLERQLAGLEAERVQQQASLEQARQTEQLLATTLVGELTGGADASDGSSSRNAPATSAAYESDSDSDIDLEQLEV